jgi:type IV secretory pathway component VirB8
MAKEANPRQVDPRISLRGVQKYLNVVEAPQIEKRRILAALLLMGAALLMLSLGMMRMLPLKERVPYVIKVEEDQMGSPTGRVDVVEGGIAKFQPSEASIRYFLGKWAVDLLTVDERTREVRLPSSYALLKGDAIGDWKRYVSDTGKPLELLAENPAYRMRAELISISFLNESTAMIRVKLTTRNEERRVQLNVNYALLPPESDADVLRNPIGLWITTFGVNNELA